MKTFVLAISLLIATIAFAGAKEIEGVDVMIKRKPPERGTTAATLRTNGAKAARADLAPGTYTVTIAFDDPSDPNAKSYFESRSNTVREIKRPDLKPDQWLGFDHWPYLYSVRGLDFTRKGESIVRKGNRIEIEQTIEVTKATKLDVVVRRTPDAGRAR